jgi:MATE family multidrug resistance protein
VAATSLVGRYIGAGHPDTAAARARLTLSMAVAYMTVCGLAFVIFRRPLVAAFVGGPELTPAIEAEIIAIGARLMICAAVFQTVDALGIVYTGALRGAGDTIWPGVMTMIYSWLFIVAGGATLVALAPGLESVGPWIGASVYIIVYGITMALRFEGGSWRSIQLLDADGRRAAAVAPIGPGAPATPEGSVRDIAEEIPEAMGVGGARPPRS